MRTVFRVVIGAAAALSLRAGAQEPAPAGQPQGQAAQGQAGQPGQREAPRQMRTMQVQGGYIRYQVMPGDDESPPGRLIVVPAERRSLRPAPLPGEDRFAARGEDLEGEERPMGPPPPQARRRPRRDGCRDTRAKLAGRLLLLRGLDVPDDVALWLERHPAYFPEGFHLVDVLKDPSLAEMVKSDLSARDYAEQLARCEARR